MKLFNLFYIELIIFLKKYFRWREIIYLLKNCFPLSQSKRNKKNSYSESENIWRIIGGKNFNQNIYSSLFSLGKFAFSFIVLFLKEDKYMLL